MTRPPFDEGDRIVLDAMPDDPDPVRRGERGVVLWVEPVLNCWHVGVRWDNGRTLALCMPPDTAHTERR